MLLLNIIGDNTMRWFRLRLDVDDFDSTVVRLHYDHPTTYVTTALLHCDLNK